MFERMSRLDALRAEATGKPEDEIGAWLGTLDHRARWAYLRKWAAFGRKELGLDIAKFHKMPDEMWDNLPEAYRTALKALMAYGDVLYRAALAKKALKALKDLG